MYYQQPINIGPIFLGLFLALGCHVVFGAIAQAIAKKKGRSGFAWGFFLGIIGIIVVGLMSDKVQSVEVQRENNAEPKDNVEKYEALEKVAQLKEKGVLSEEEFQTEKDQILNGVKSFDKEEAKENACAQDEAWKAFELAGKEKYPNGFKCHWGLQLYNSNQLNDGSWKIKVGVTIKDESKIRRDVAAKGIVAPDGKSVSDFECPVQMNWK